MVNNTYILCVLAVGFLGAVTGSSSSAAPADSVKVVSPADSVDQVSPADTVRAATGDLRRAGTPRKDAEISPEERARLKNTLQMMGRKEVEGDKLWQRRKSPKLAMYSNALLPGLGQVYNGRRIKTAMMVAAASYYFGNVWLNHKSAQRWEASRSKLPENARLRTLILHNNQIEFFKEQSKDYLWWSGAVWIIGMIDAWIDAHLYDIRAYKPPEVTGPVASPAAGSAPAQYLTLTISF